MKFRKFLTFLIIIAPLFLVFYFFNPNSITGYAIYDSYLIAHYPFEKNLKDINEGHDGFLNNAEYTEGIIGSALKLNGRDHVDLPIIFIESRSQISFSLWIKPEAGTGDYQMILWEGEETGNGYGLDNEFHISLNRDLTEASFVLSDKKRYLEVKGPINKDEWTHLAATANHIGANNTQMNFYIDGEFIGQKNASTNLSVDYNKKMRIGRPGEGTRFYKGLIDELKIYDTVLTKNEILDLFEEGFRCNSHLQCKGGKVLPVCIEGSACQQGIFAECINPKTKNSYCQYTNQTLCESCSHGCESGQCLPEIPAEIEFSPQEAPKEDPGFFKKVWCKIRYPFNTDNYQKCL